MVSLFFAESCQAQRFQNVCMDFSSNNYFNGWRAPNIPSSTTFQPAFAKSAHRAIASAVKLAIVAHALLRIPLEG